MERYRVVTSWQICFQNIFLNMQDAKEIYAVALSMLRGLSPDIVKMFPDVGITVEDFFNLDKNKLKSFLGLSDCEFIEKMRRDEALFKAKKEFEFIKRHKIQCIFLLNPDYPTRLFNISDPPIVLYKVGPGDLDPENIISVVGTRRPTQYGIDFCNDFLEDLSAYFPQLTTVSGLAHGIDSCVHKTSITHNLPTIAVVAHGLNMIYPAQNRPLAHEIIKKGGAIISEYPFGEKPYRQRFLERNRIVAGLSDVTVIVESALKGGAMSTANLAFSYSREVMALPGRISDDTSEGCNHLIRKEKAHLLTSAADIIEVTGWKPMDLPVDAHQRNLFPELEGDSKIIYDILRFNKEPLQLDRLHQLTMIPMAKLMSTLGELEFDGIISRYPGNRYSIS